MEPAIVIRKAVLEDLHSVLKLANQLSETIHVSEQYLLDHFAKLIGDKQHCLLVATNKEAVIGYVSGYFHQAIYAGGPVAYIDEIVVEAPYRTLKIGSSLMAQFEQICREHGCLLVSLATYGAKHFYEKLGYNSKAGYFKKYLR